MSTPSQQSGAHSRRYFMLALVSLCELLGMSAWFAAGAAGPHLQQELGLSRGQMGGLAAAVQIGFVAGTALLAALNLADIVTSRRLFATCAMAAAVANASLLVSPGYSSAMASRFVTGALLAGVYPPALKMISTWFASARGLALGTVVGALTVGKAMPWLIAAANPRNASMVILAASAAGVVAGLLIFTLYRDGPHAFLRRSFSWTLAGDVLRNRPTRLAIAGYLGHMWELYAMWTWAPAFVAASLAFRATAQGTQSPAWLAGAISFGAIAAGGLGCLWGGWQGDRIGRERTVMQALAASGACCLVAGFTFGAHPWLVAGVTWIWGFFVVADSAQFSGMVTEVAPPHCVGTALTLQISLGFLLTVVTIEAIPVIVRAAGWPWAFPLLALGPVAGIEASRRLARLRSLPT